MKQKSILKSVKFNVSCFIEEQNIYYCNKISFRVFCLNSNKKKKGNAWEEEREKMIGDRLVSYARKVLQWKEV